MGLNRINEDYNGECIILQPLNELDEMNKDYKYFVIDFSDCLILIYPSVFQKKVNYTLL